MKNRKGLTLIELLAVIVVLAILALITIPIISNVIDNVRIKSLQNSAYGLIEASNLYYISKGNNTTVRFDKNDSIDTLKELSYKGVVKIGTVIIDKKGKVTVCITDGKNSAYKNYNETRVNTSKGKICSIRENSSIVYLDDEATITEYSLSELTELVNELKSNVDNLKEENITLKNMVNSNNSNINSQISDIRNSKTTLNDVYPVGSVYITVTEDTTSQVQAKFGGTWEAFGSGRTLVGVDISQSEFNSVGKTGGEKTHTLTEAELAKVTYSLKAAVAESNSGVSGWALCRGGYTCSGWGSMTSGGDQPHNNLQPYITVYMYKRTA